MANRKNIYTYEIYGIAGRKINYARLNSKLLTTCSIRHTSVLRDHVYALKPVDYRFLGNVISDCRAEIGEMMDYNSQLVVKGDSVCVRDQHLDLLQIVS